MTRKFLSAAVAAAMMATTAPVLAQDSQGLYGVKRTTAEDSLRAQGYASVGTSNLDGRNWHLWSRNSSPRCVGFTASAGMVTASSTFNRQQCGQSGGGGGNNTGAAVAGVAVAAILGAALLSHHDKHYDQGYRPSNNNASANFERGYQDGLHDGPFTSSGNNPDYNQGYNAGQQERTNRLRANRESWDGGGGGKSAARAACARYASEEWGASAHAVGARSSGSGWAVDVTAGYESATCIYENGRVTSLG